MKLTAIPSPVKWINVPTNEPGYNLLLMREGRRVYAQAVLQYYPGAGMVKLADIPIGYRPNMTHRLPYGENSGELPSKLMVVFAHNVGVELRGKTAGASVFFNTEWTTDDAPPPLLSKLFALVAGWWK